MAETGSWSPYYITEPGRNLRQRNIAEGKRTVFTRAVIGIGKPSDTSSIDTMTGLVTYAKDVVIKKSYALEANHLCIVRVDNSGYTQAVFMTEVGVYARSEDQQDSDAVLYGYAYNLDGYVLIPAQTSATNRKIYEITLDTYLSQSAEIQIIYDNTGLWVSHADLDDLLEALNARQVAYSNSNMPDVGDVWQGLDTLNENKVNVSQAIQWYELPLLNGFEGFINYCKDNAGTVYINGSLRRTKVPAPLEVFGQMPVGFCPDISVVYPCVAQHGSNGSSFCSYAFVAADGKMSFTGGPLPSNFSTASTIISFCLSYPTTTH